MGEKNGGKTETSELLPHRGSMKKKMEAKRKLQSCFLIGEA